MLHNCYTILGNNQSLFGTKTTRKSLFFSENSIAMAEIRSTKIFSETFVRWNGEILLDKDVNNVKNTLYP